ncbi:hypothetical protein SRB5_25270 [Streptomyces sp. RB5]|uniref:Uncharacterized protein n=1 Tax=Streptomyces smaragdinus TaxID=2585196 RepID=A0A7K0CI44_9ACTN|nr:hypothetical protein [Streptomyces smaragdinus]MQY12394.1 hypothetical protein [Streptomyces smaragdinus]
MEVLRWRTGDGPMAEWIERVQRLVFGPGTFELSGPAVWPDHPYGMGLGSGLDARGVAELLTADGVGRLYVSFSRGMTLTAPTADILAVTGRAADGRGSGHRATYTPDGPVKLAAPVRSPAELGAWLDQLAPLFPAPVEVPDRSTEPFPVPLATGLLSGPDTVTVCVDTLTSRESVVNPTTVVSVAADPSRIPVDAALGCHPAVLRTYPAATSRELAHALAGLAAAWGAPADDGAPPERASYRRGTTLRVLRIEHRRATLRLSRPGAPELHVTGDVSRPAAWTAPLFSPALHESRSTGSRRGLQRWLEGVGQAVYGGPAAWSVTGATDSPAMPLGAADLARWLKENCPGRRLSVGEFTPEGETELLSTRTRDGWATVTGRRRPDPGTPMA